MTSTSFFHAIPSAIKRLVLVSAVALGAVAIWSMNQDSGEGGVAKAPDNSDSGRQSTVAKPALTVTAITPRLTDWPNLLTANGNVVAWQEAVISSEVSNLRLTEVRVNVGDRVQKGQVLARISDATVAAELLGSRAAVAEAEAMLVEAKSNGERGRQLKATGFISAQQLNRYVAAEETAQAQLQAARARMQANQLRLDQTIVRAPDSGVISARTATLGSLAQPGQELFRLIRGSRLEWRAEVSAADLGKLKPGDVATLTTPNGARVKGRVRMIAPTVNPQTLNGLVYVDLPPDEAADAMRAGSFARGEFELGRTRSMSLPQSAVLLRDGFAYVFQLLGENKVAQNKVTQVKVGVGQRRGDQIEIVSGITPDTRVVASGAGFLSDGDAVRVVDAPLAASTKP
jgi:RND family efflux transporter MFP subunit